jgi:hypothetical protein
MPRAREKGIQTLPEVPNLREVALTRLNVLENAVGVSPLERLIPPTEHHHIEQAQQPGEVARRQAACQAR